MRILKFRAWLKKDKKMVGVKMIGGGYLWTDENWIDSINVNLAEIAHEIGVTCEVMQFTGLLDKSGKEIYEGDVFNCIYEFDGCKKHKQVVIYVEVSARFITKDYGKCHQSGVTQTMSDMHRMEVIGNIYENPELLNQN